MNVTALAECIQLDCGHNTYVLKELPVPRKLNLPIAKGSKPASTRRLRRGPSVEEDWTNQGRARRRLGEPNAGRALGSPRPAAVPQSVLRGGLSQSHDLLRALRAAYRSGTHVRSATFGMLRFPSTLFALRPNDTTKIAPQPRSPRCGQSFVMSI